MPFFTRTFSCILIASVGLLAACGGGGDVGTTTTPSAGSTGNPTGTGTGTGATSGASPVDPVVNTSAFVVPSETSCSINNFQADMLAAINAARAEARMCGTEAKPAVPALSWNAALFAAAAGHSQDMVKRNFFSHTSPDGIDFVARLTNAGYKSWATGENIAAGQIGIASVMGDWLKSPGHCNGIMSGGTTEVAVACVATSTADYKTYWTMDLGKAR